MKTLVICRHAKSDWPIGMPDIERPLKQRGISDAQYLGMMLGQQNFEPDLIVSSPANRALSTAKIVGKKLHYDESDIKVEKTIYESGTSGLIEFIQKLPSHADTVMIFGHNPTSEDTVRTLLQMSASFMMPTCAMACMESRSDNWQHFDARSIHLRWYLVPRLLRHED
ncbi:MAG: histidine phosphatase family protein [Bacteroidia bacterium]|nr:histidine phosphatase family protein [Bacteroidia bacterium]